MMLTQEDYRDFGGGVCPQCQTWDYTSEKLFDQGDQLAQDRRCNRCGLAWTAVFRIAGYIRHGWTADQDAAAFKDVRCVDLNTLKPVV